MSADRPELETRVAERLARVVASSADWVSSTREEEQDLRLLEQRLADRRRAGRHTRSALLLAGALLVGAGTYWGLGRVSPFADRAISYRIADGPARRQGALAAAASTVPTEVSFSDGTRMQLEPRSYGRVVDLDRRGGRVALDDGKARVDVRHRPHARWVFQAGPFEVRVHGTSFSVAWNAVTARFDLHMESGVVSVAGPISGGEIFLHAGESLSVTLDQHQPSAAAAPRLPAPGPTQDPRDQDDRAVSASPPSPAPLPVAPAPEARRDRMRDQSTGRRDPGAASAVAPPRARALARWRGELAAGHARAVVADAERMGAGRVLESVGSEDLASLADAARYVGDEELARRAFLAQRRRFPSSSRAAEAAFLLGRLEDESGPGAERALAWYDLYLGEAPGGAYAAEALGRKMMVLERARRHDEASAIAADYLRRFPRGSYAHAAEVVVGPSGRDAARAAGPTP